ncbi:MAG TPA: hypothetical protein PK177_01700 [Burkholderiaceae bacterium]|nr:hypothetical protein [Burkholderiaceae bacterium]
MEFIVTAEQAQLFLDLLKAGELRLFYATLPTEYGIVGEKSS